VKQDLPGRGGKGKEEGRWPKQCIHITHVSKCKNDKFFKKGFKEFTKIIYLYIKRKK
jgi:hypothetical protein